MINRILISAAAAYLISGLLKMLFTWIAYDRVDVTVFLKTGGMPSSHTSVVSSMTTAVYMMQGASELFAVCIIVSLIIASDAMGIRRAAGKQALVINKMVDEFRYFRKFKTKRLHQLLGHTPKQTIAGLLLGILIARIVFLF